MLPLYITSICVIKSARILFAYDDSSSFNNYFHARIVFGCQFLIINCRYVFSPYTQFLTYMRSSSKARV